MISTKQILDIIKPYLKEEPKELETQLDVILSDSEISLGTALELCGIGSDEGAWLQVENREESVKWLDRVDMEITYDVESVAVKGIKRAGENWVFILKDVTENARQTKNRYYRVTLSKLQDKNYQRSDPLRLVNNAPDIIKTNNKCIYLPENFENTQRRFFQWLKECGAISWEPVYLNIIETGTER